MTKIEEYVRPVQELDRQEFVKAYPHPFLLLYLENVESSGEWSFKTTTIASEKINIAKLLKKGDLMLAEDSDRYRVFALVKSLVSPWRERISVGRARNNDVALPNKSVSKLHAHFTFEEGTAWLTDAGSRNGTRVNGDKLRAGKPVKTVPGDVITFGGVSLRFIDAGSLHDLVRKQLKPRKKRS